MPGDVAGSVEESHADQVSTVPESSSRLMNKQPLSLVAKDEAEGKEFTKLTFAVVGLAKPGPGAEGQTFCVEEGVDDKNVTVTFKPPTKYVDSGVIVAKAEKKVKLTQAVQFPLRANETVYTAIADGFVTIMLRRAVKSSAAPVDLLDCIRTEEELATLV